MQVTATIGQLARPSRKKRLTYFDAWAASIRGDLILTLTQRAVLEQFARHVRLNPTRTCWPSDERIARALGISVPTVERAVCQLKRLGYISCVTIRKARTTSIRYTTLNLDQIYGEHISVDVPSKRWTNCIPCSREIFHSPHAWVREESDFSQIPEATQDTELSQDEIKDWEQDFAEASFPPDPDDFLDEVSILHDPRVLIPNSEPEHTGFSQEPPQAVPAQDSPHEPVTPTTGQTEAFSDAPPKLTLGFDPMPPTARPVSRDVQQFADRLNTESRAKFDALPPGEQHRIFGGHRDRYDWQRAWHEIDFAARMRARRSA